MDLYVIIFYAFAAITIISGLIVVTTRNVIYAAFNLMLTLFGVAGLYVLLGADFIGIVQLIVYVGGILILLLFGVMLTNNITDVSIKTGVIQVLPATIVLGLFGGVLIGVIINAPWKNAPTMNDVFTINAIGKSLMNEYILIFELLGVVLLIALIGAASIARSK